MLEEHLCLTEEKLAKALEALKIDPWFIGYGGWKKHILRTPSQS
jgi:hypothetical protein